MKITPLKMWVQNVLPVVYDDSLSYYEMVGKINEKTNEIIEQVNENTDGIEALNKIIEQLGDVNELKALLEEVETIVDDLYSTDTPEMDSTNGSAGVADHAARSDHSHPSDSSKADVSLGIDGALAGQYVKIKTVEAGIPTEFVNGLPHEIPSGGTTGQALRKESNGDYAADWGDVHEIPNGGSAGQALRKESNGDYAADWGDVHEIPNGGSAGQIFRKNSNTNYDAGWSDEHGIPTAGANNDILVKDGTANYAAKWTNTPEQMGSLATIERTNAASKAYTNGDYLVYNGQLYRVTANNITQGQTLNPGQGGNIQAVTNGGFNELNSIINYAHNISAGSLLTAGEHFTVNSATYTRIGNLVCWQAQFTTSAAANAGDTIASGFNTPFYPAANIVTTILFDQGAPNTIRLASLHANGDLKTNVAFSAAGIGFKINMVYAI